MAHEYTTWAYKQPVTPSGAKFILVALADTADADGYSFPGQKRLASMTGQSERSVREHLAMLEAHGFVKRAQRRRNDGTRTSDAYFLPRKDSTGEICRWEPTGKSRQSHRQISPKSPAKSAGHELPGEPPGEPPVNTTSPDGDKLAKRDEAKVGKSDVQRVVDTYNDHRGSLPKAQAVNSSRATRIKSLIRDMGSVEEAIAVMGIAASEVSQDPFWQRRKYGIDNLLNGQKVVQKAESAVSRGTTDRAAAERARMLAALGPN